LADPALRRIRTASDDLICAIRDSGRAPELTIAIRKTQEAQLWAEAALTGELGLGVAPGPADEPDPDSARRKVATDRAEAVWWGAEIIAPGTAAIGATEECFSFGTRFRRWLFGGRGIRLG
jgi:hypothetical protein